jgi:hypothetical protein
MHQVLAKDGSLSLTDEGLGKIFGERVWAESQIEENLPW